MKKLFSISFALLILLSGMHLTIATHICKGTVAATKWSFIGEEATCGMESSKQACPVHKTFNSNCCQNVVAVYSVDNNYDNSSFQFKEVTKNLIQIFVIPFGVSLNSSIAANLFNTSVSPPDIAMTSAVSLDDICIFRI